MGKKRKGDDSWQLDQRELAFAQRLVKPEQKKLKKEVQEELTEVNFEVKDWYPIHTHVTKHPRNWTTNFRR